MIETVTITRVSATDKKSDGTPLKSKFGPYFRVGIQIAERLTTEGTPIWINGFLKKRPTWNNGDKIEVELTEELYNGEKRLAFRLPKKEVALEERVKKLEDKVFGTTEAITTNKNEPEKTADEEFDNF